MPSTSDWKVSSSVQPGLKTIPMILSALCRRWWGCAPRCRRTPLPPRRWERRGAGHGVLIRNDGLILTIGYLITEADQIWIHLR